MALTKAHNRMISDVAYTATGNSANIVVNESSATLQSGGRFKIAMAYNSDHGMTLNGTAIKVLDIVATEQSQWTITSAVSASKDQTKTNVYRTVCENMLSEDVVYEFRYLSSEGFYEVTVEHIYKHLFIQCGNGKDIPELQDAINFAGQFTSSTNMDPQFVQVNAGTEYFPNKGQITITLPQGTSGSPVTSTMTKRIRAGEADLANIEILNEGFYEGNADTDACKVRLNFLPNSDDTALLNFWKTNLGEVRNITWVFDGQFSANNQAVVKYIDSRSKFKDCVIDITSATAAGGVTSAYGFFDDQQGNSNSLTIKCPSTATSWLTALATASGGSSITIEGKPNIAVEVFNDVQFYSLHTPDTPAVLFASNRSWSNITVNSSAQFRADDIFNRSTTFEGAIWLQSSISLSGITNITNFHPSINRFDENANIIYTSTKGAFKNSWMPYNVVTVTSGDTEVTLDDEAYNQLFISSGSATITTINLDIGAFDGFSTDYAIKLLIKKGGSGTLSLGYSASGNVLPSNSGAAYTITNPNEPIWLVYDPSNSRWCPIVHV